MLDTPRNMGSLCSLIHQLSMINELSVQLITICIISNEYISHTAPIMQLIRNP